MRPSPFVRRSNLVRRLTVASLVLAGIGIVFPAVAAPAAPETDEADHPVDPALFQGMKWRSIGPYRGGRATAVTGVPGEPFTYYFGSTGGGVWKTTDGGTTWENVSDDHFETGSVGALAVAPSDPNVVYAGMGEAPIRGVTTSHGDGVYRSTDAGRTWTHLGLEGTEHISVVAVHPSDPDRAWVAAQGSAWQPTEERGVYRTEDGGATWERGGQGIVPRYLPEEAREDAAMLCVHHMERSPVAPDTLFMQFHGGVYRSDDGGREWTSIADGLPSDFGFPLVADPRRADRAFVIPLVADVDRVTPGGRVQVWETADGGASWTERSDGLPREEAYLTVLRQAFCHDGRDPLGLYFGATSGEVFGSGDGGRTWRTLARRLPPVLGMRAAGVPPLASFVGGAA